MTVFLARSDHAGAAQMAIRAGRPAGTMRRLLRWPSGGPEPDCLCWQGTLAPSIEKHAQNGSKSGHLGVPGTMEGGPCPEASRPAPTGRPGGVQKRRFLTISGPDLANSLLVAHTAKTIVLVVERQIRGNPENRKNTTFRHFPSR